MKNKTILLIVLISLAIFIIFGVLSCSLMVGYYKEHKGFDVSFYNEKSTVVQNAEVSLEGIKNIEISAIDSHVILTESDEMLTSKLTFATYNNSAKIELTSFVDGDTAYIDVIYPQSNINIFNSNLTVGLPANFDGNITVKTISGGVNGDLKNSLSAFKMGTTSGGLELSAPRISDVSFKSISGSMDLDASIENSLFASSTSGSYTVEAIDNADATVTLKTISGSMTMVYNKACPTTIQTTSGYIDLSLLDNAAIALDFSSTSGDVEGPVRTDPDGIPFDITSVSGGLSFE